MAENDVNSSGAGLNASSTDMLQCYTKCQNCLLSQAILNPEGKVTLSNCQQATPTASAKATEENASNAGVSREKMTEDQGQTEVEDQPESPRLLCVHCSDHGEKFLYFCDQCVELICQECVVHGAKHHSHDFKSIDVSFQKYEEDITPLLEKMESKTSDLNRVLAEMDKHIAEVTHHQSAIRTKILRSSEKLHEIIRRRQDELISQLDQIAERKLKSLAVQKSQIESLMANLDGSLKTARKSLTSEFRNKALALKSAMLERIEEQTEIFVFTPVTESDMEFSVSEDFIAGCKTYGAVHSRNSLDPSKCYAIGRGTEEVMVGEKATIVLTALSFKGTPYEAVIPSAFFEVELVSEADGRCVQCGTIKHRRQEQYVISYKPTVKGRYRLHIKADGQHIKGSPYSVIVKLPVDKLGIPIRTLNDVAKPMGVTVNGKGELVVTECHSHRVSVFCPHGVKSLSFGGCGAMEGQFQDPRGVAVDGDGNILVADRFRLQKFTTDGHFLEGTSLNDSGVPQLLKPSGIAYSTSNNKMYVSDRNHRVLVLNSDLTVFSQFGKKGTDRGQFDSPCGIAIANTGKVYVADKGNHRIQVFTAEGNFLKMFSVGGEELVEPVDVAVDVNGLVYVSENRNCRVSVFTPKGELVTSFGGNGSQPGQFNNPRGLAVDSNGIVYVCDSLNNCIQMF